MDKQFRLPYYFHKSTLAMINNEDIAMISKRNTGKCLHVTNSKLVLRSYRFKLISYWRLKQNTTSSLLCQHIIGNR